VVEETLHHRGTTLVRRRLLLAPGASTRWHRDPFNRVTVVLNGDALALEFCDGRPTEHINVTPGQVDWDEPSDRTHRAINTGDVSYEEITVFFLTQAERSMPAARHRQRACAEDPRRHRRQQAPAASESKEAYGRCSVFGGDEQVDHERRAVR